MAQTLRDFLSTRESEIKRQIAALDSELRELRAAREAIESNRNNPDNVKQASPRMTHRDMIIAVLDEYPNGGTSDKVIDWVKAQFDVEIPQASMSSQLSRAKSDGVLDLEPINKTWRLKKHAAGLYSRGLAPSALPNSGAAAPEQTSAGTVVTSSGAHNPQPSPARAQD